jgi:tripartite-type tricarboxylate transporter receptor subunit TctC
LNASARRALARPAVLERLQRLGIETRPLTPGEFSAFIAAETEKWSAIIRRSGAKAE